MVVFAKHSVHNVLFLIFSFVNTAVLFVLLKAEYIAMVLSIVYVGAVAILFLFVVMMLDVDFNVLKKSLKAHLPVAAFVGGILFFELAFIVFTWKFSSEMTSFIAQPLSSFEETTNVHAVARIIYTDHFLSFQTAGYILLLAMVGAIVLTLRQRQGVKKQNIGEQVSRTETVVLKKVKKGEGVQ